MDRSDNMSIFQILNGNGEFGYNNQVQQMVQGNNHGDLNLSSPSLSIGTDENQVQVEGQGYRRRHFRSSSITRTPRVPIIAPPSPPPRDINQLKMRFLFEKQLQISDVNATGRIVIPKNFAEDYLPPLESKEGIWLHIDDMDFLRVWTLKFRYWPNNSSRMYVLENTRGLVATHKLAADDFIMVFKDDENDSYLIRTRKYVLNSSQIPALMSYNTEFATNNNIAITPPMINEYGNYQPNNNDNIIINNYNNNNNNNSVDFGFNNPNSEFFSTAGAQPPAAPEFGQLNDNAEFQLPESFVDLSFFGL